MSHRLPSWAFPASVPPGCGCGDEMTPEERRRWVLGDVIYDAVGLVLEKYGHEDSCGVALGMGEDCAYGCLARV